MTLNLTNLIGFGVQGNRTQSIFQLISGLGLGTNLTFCLDAGASNSYPGSGTKWLDQTSGGYDFFLGTDGSTNAPTFNGTPGAGDSTNYWTNWNSAAARFRYDSTTPAAFDAWHQNNAALTFMAIYTHRSPGGNNVTLLGSDGGSVSNRGIRWWFGGSNAPTFTASNGSGGAALNVTAGTGLSDGTTYILFLSYDEAAGAGFQRANKTGIHTISGGYSSPSASAATYTAEIMRAGNGGLDAWPDNANLYGFATWSTALSTTNCDDIHDAINGARNYV